MTYSLSLQSVLVNAIQSLADFAADPLFAQHFRLVFGIEISSQQFLQIIEDLPEIAILPDEVLPGAFGAFSVQTGTIYLSESAVNGDSGRLQAVLLEEIGHFIDAQVNTMETLGDEGELFSAIVRGVDLSPTDLGRIQTEDDHATITLKGENIAIEQATVTLPSDNRIAAVLGGYKWGIPTITYSFYGGGSYYGSEAGLAPLSDAMKKSVRDFLEYSIEPLINVNFVEVNDSPSSYGLLRYFLSTDPGYAYAYYPFATDTNQGNSDDQAGDAFFNRSYDYLGDDAGFQGGFGTHGYMAILHETLHALGLKHPGDYNGNGTGDPPFLPFNQDNQDNTVMTYNFTDNAPSSPMPYDVLGLQYLYGARSYNNSNTNYLFSTVFGYSDGVQTVGSINAATPTKLTLWDSGGVDTLDFSGLAINAGGYRFDLNEGGWLTTQNAFNSETYRARGDSSNNNYFVTNLGTRLAFGVQIENAIGTASNDTFLGNALANIFTGRAGNDSLFGGDGNDIAVYTGLSTQYQITPGSAPGTYTITDLTANRDGIDTLNLIEQVRFSDQTITLGAFSLPTLSIDDVTVTEANNGSTINAIFTVTRSGLASQAITVSYATAAGTATAGTDFVSTSGTLTFGVNETSKTIMVVVNGDNSVEGNETFFVNLTNPVNATIADGQGAGTILNNDATGIVNNNFANRSVLTGGSATATGSNIGATGETGEPNHGGVSTPINSVWWSWTAIGNGTVTISTAGSDFDTTLGVYTGSSVSALTAIASNDDFDEGIDRSSLVNFAVTEETTYQIAVDGYSGAIGNINLALNFLPAGPVNDNFINRTVLTGNTVTATGSNVDATGETGEPNHASASTPINSVWWSWTAVGNGMVTINTAGSDFDTTLGVYTGSLGASLTVIASNDDVNGSLDRTSSVTFDAIDGTTYQIAVDGYDAATGNVNLGINFVPIGPANDNFANRIVLTGNTITTTGTNIGATEQSNEPNHADVSTPINSVWWSWTATTNGTVTINTAGSDFDTTLGVYTGSLLSNLTAIASNDDTSISTTSEVSFDAISGTTYQIAIDGYGAATGDINLALNFVPLVPAPANDNFANRIILTGNTITTTGTNIDATGQSGEPNHVNVSTPINSVWWSWTATGNGTVTLSTAGSNFDTTLGVYTGNSLSALTAIASNDDSPSDLTSYLTFAATSGTTYQIAVDGYSAATGNISLALNFIGTSTFTGTTGNDTLNGTSGADTLIGLAGNDTYIVNNSGDVVVETANQGTDTVKTDISYTLGANVEKLTLNGSGNLNGTGNELNNTLTGNAGVNTLTGLGGNDIIDGKAGADTMIGGAGNDTYTVDNIGDVVIENLNEGTDTVKTTIDYTLGANLENLTLNGTANINGTGNTLNNKLTGNSGANILNGGAGADILAGKAGNDTFVFRFGQSTTTALDRITDFAIGSDKIDLLTQGGSAMNAPVAFTRAADSTTTSINTIVTNVFADANGATAGNQALGVNSAALVKAGTSTYIIVNDGTTGFQSANDLVINLTGITGTLPAVGSITVSSLFV